MTQRPHDAAGPRIGPDERAVQIPSVLQAAGVLDGLRRRGDRLVGPCPIHGGDNPTAFSVDLRLNRWFCFTGCSAGGDVVDLVRRLHRVGFRDAAALLAGLSATGASPLPAASPTDRPVEPFRPFRRAIPLNPESSFLRGKGISPATAAHHDVGAYAGDGWLKGCVGLRLHDPTGGPLGYLGRALVPTHLGRWKVPPRLPKAQILYNYHRVAARRPPPILAVTECPWGVLRLAQLGIPAVALLGVHLSPVQRELLARSERVVLILDGDPPGITAAARIRDTLRGQTEAIIVRLPDRLDPDDLADPELLALASPSFLLDQPTPRSGSTPHRT
ncbi:MAG: toprim domain-containing protein [Nocardioidaceae bacterium]